MEGSLRLVTWNCRSGSVTARVDQLRVLAPDMVFLQETDPARGGCVAGVICSRAVKTRKGIALCAPSQACRCSARRLPAGSGRAAIAATLRAAIVGLADRERGSD